MLKHKLFAALALLLAALFAFAGCAGKTPQTPTGTGEESTSAPEPADTSAPGAASDAELLSEIYPEGAQLPYVYLACDVQELRPGDAFDVAVRIANAENFAACQILISFDPERFELERTVNGSVEDVIVETSSLENQVQSFIITARTVDITDDEVLTLKLKVLSGAAAGETEIEGDISQFLIGTDDGGAVTADLAAVKTMSAGLTLQIAG